MCKIDIGIDMLNGEGEKILGKGRVTDKKINVYGWGNPDKELKFVVCKGYASDWCVYIEPMDKDLYFEGVQMYGTKLTCKEKIMMLVDCSEEVFDRYRF